MTMITTIFHDETTNKALRGTEMIPGWSVIRTCFVRVPGDPGIRLAIHPHAGSAAHDWIRKIRKNNQWLNELCQKTVPEMNDHVGKCLLCLARSDDGRERVSCQIVAYKRIADDTTVPCRAENDADPESVKLNRGSASRATDNTKICRFGFFIGVRLFAANCGRFDGKRYGKLVEKTGKKLGKRLQFFKDFLSGFPALLKRA